MARELIWTGFMSLDGVVDSPGSSAEGHPHGGWVFRTPFSAEAYSLKAEELEETSALMFGRRSYEAFAPFWRTSDDHVAYRDLPKYIVSRSLDPAALIDGWGEQTVLRSTDDVAALKQTEGGAVFIHGSAELGRRLAEADLIDRYNLLIFPVLLGDGKRVFPDVGQDERRLVLRASDSYDNGVVKVVYEVTHGAR